MGGRGGSEKAETEAEGFLPHRRLDVYKLLSDIGDRGRLRRRPDGPRLLGGLCVLTPKTRWGPRAVA
jgi:hypothetical protein